jgi:hypothetical protein
MNEEIYDVITKRPTTESIRELARKFGGDHSNFGHLKIGNQKVVGNRFCLTKNKDALIFTLVDLKSKEEFDCLNNLTIFIYLGKPYDNEEARLVYRLKARRQIIATIAGRPFCLKGRESSVKMEHFYRSKSSHLFSEEISARQKRNKEQGKIRAILACRIANVIRLAKSQKMKKSMELVGCSIEFLIKYLEDQFVDGMSWENRGKGIDKWHIDHIRPCNTFDLTREDDQKRCFHYTNLRPLWEKDNLERPKDGRDVFGYGIDI